MTPHPKDNSGSYPKTLVAMTATLNADFTKYTNKKLEITEDRKNTLQFPVSSFLYEASLEYFKVNKKLPGGIIIYRQGVSKEQRFYLNSEVEQVEKLLTGQGDFTNKLEIPYYYILVNKKTSLKFFECDANPSSYIERNSKTSYSSGRANFNSSVINTGNYDNPDPGLLICNGITSPEIFEFYIQPQKVNQGTATPTNFHVAYGNLNCPQLIPKLTYDLCYLYCNWRGPVRVPAPLKYAEKLAKVITKVNDKTKNSLYYV